MDASELYDPEFRELIEKQNPTIIIPIGSLEQHGAHLPITTDSDIVTEIALRLAKECGFIVFPTISYGFSDEHWPMINASVDFSEMLHDLIRSLVSNGIKSVIILNGHHGNVKRLEAFERWHQGWEKRLQGIKEGVTGLPASVILEQYRFKDFKISYHSYWHFMEREFDHAGFVETSIMLAISDKVKMKKAKKGFTTKGMSEKEIQRIKKLSTQRGGFIEFAKNGVWGDPTKATKKDGEKFLAEIVRNLAKECQS